MNLKSKCVEAILVMKNAEGLSQKYKEQVLIDFYKAANPRAVLELVKKEDDFKKYSLMVSRVFVKFKDSLGGDFLQEFIKESEKLIGEME